jgi:hypothetical protein
MRSEAERNGIAIDADYVRRRCRSKAIGSRSAASSAT